MCVKDTQGSICNFSVRPNALCTVKKRQACMFCSQLHLTEANNTNAMCLNKPGSVQATKSLAGVLSKRE